MQSVLSQLVVSHIQKAEHSGGSANALPSEVVGSKLMCHLILRLACTTPDAILPPHVPLSVSSRLRPGVPSSASADAEQQHHEAIADDASSSGAGSIFWLPSWNITDRGIIILRDSSLVHMLNAEFAIIGLGTLY